jgi:hypothetical protein
MVLDTKSNYEWIISTNPIRSSIIPTIVLLFFAGSVDRFFLFHF